MKWFQRYIILGLYIHVFTEMVSYNCFIIFHYYYLNIKILKIYENFQIFETFWNFMKIWNFFEFFWKFWNFEIVWKFWTLKKKNYHFEMFKIIS
jgi:hypothetical protein